MALSSLSWRQSPGQSNTTVHILDPTSTFHMTIWPSGLRRQFKALVFTGGGSNPPVVTIFVAHALPAYQKYKNVGSKCWFRSNDLWVMGPARFPCANLLWSGSNILDEQVSRIVMCLPAKLWHELCCHIQLGTRYMIPSHAQKPLTSLELHRAGPQAASAQQFGPQVRCADDGWLPSYVNS